MIGPKHDLKLPGSNCKKKLRPISKSDHQHDVLKPGLSYFLTANAIEISTSSSDLSWIPDRKVNRTSIGSFPSQDEMEECVTALGVKLGPLVPLNRKDEVIKLLYQYRHLNSVDLSDLPETDLIIHRVRLVPGTKPHSVGQKRWPPHKEWWLRKLVQDGINGGVYEKTGLIDGRLSPWNARAVLVDKVENPTPNDEPRMTYDYSRVVEELPGTHMPLMSGCHDYLSDPRHRCFMTADLKHAYSTVLVHPEDRKFFAFTIPGMGQLQPTRMQQGSKSASFTMSELMARALGKIPGEPSLLQSQTPESPPFLAYYQDDIMGGHGSFQEQLAFLRDHFFPRIEWARLRLSFKKLFLFQTSVRALGMQHHIGGRITILNERIEKIARFPVPEDKTGIRAFLGTIGITRRWVPNFSEISRPLTRLTGRAEWRWTEPEALSFEILKVKCATISSMFGYDYSLPAHFYTDASKYACGLAITQFQFQEEEGKVIEVPVQYDSITFTSTEVRYPTYKRELCALTKFVIKYDHLCKHPRITAVIHTDHKPLVQFLKSDSHEGIYGHWADKLRRLNLEIQYIPGRRNRVADGLSRTLFLAEDCTADSNVIEAWRAISKEGPKWVWKDGKGGYQAFLDSLNDSDRTEVISGGTLHGENVFSQSLSVGATVDPNRDSWEKAYLASEWFADIYRAHTTDQPFSLPGIFSKAMNFRVDPHTKVLWKHHQDLFLPCVPESKVLGILKQAHDESGHWAKQGTIAKLRGTVYWPSQSTDVERYIKGCIPCARHGPAQRSQLLQPIRVHGPFQLMGFDFIGPLPKTKTGSVHIFHVMDYFSRFSMTFPSGTATAEDVVPFLGQVFARYTRPLGIYCDRGHHFQNTLVKDYLVRLGITLTFSPSGASQSTGMIEIGNRLLEDILRKTTGDQDWEQVLPKATYDLNARTIHHLGASPASILFGIFPDVPITDTSLRQPIGVNLIHEWVNLILNPYSHKKLFQDFHEHRSQLHDRVRVRSDQRKDEEAAKFDKGIQPREFAEGDLVFLYQKNTGKLEPRWRGPFRVEGYGGTHGISYEIRQLNGRRIKGTFHGNHLKKYVPRTGHLSSSDHHQFPGQQTIRNRKGKQAKTKA